MRVASLLVVLLVAAGCSLSDDSGATIDFAQLQRLVLQPGDVGPAFTRFDEGRQGGVDLPAGVPPGGEGWKARYRRPGTPATEGPLVIASLVNRFPSAEDADEQLEARRSDLEGSDIAWREEPATGLGEEAVAFTHEEGSGATRVGFAVVAWRRANITASIEVNGFAGNLGLEDALELARKQAARIDEAAS
jgi:hypothetical protein